MTKYDDKGKKIGMIVLFGTIILIILLLIYGGKILDPTVYKIVDKVGNCATVLTSFDCVNCKGLYAVELRNTNNINEVFTNQSISLNSYSTNSKSEVYSTKISNVTIFYLDGSRDSYQFKLYVGDCSEDVSFYEIYIHKLKYTMRGALAWLL